VSAVASEKAYLVLTAVGPDRPGLVSEISAAIHGAGANLEDSRMAILGGEFALLLLLSGSEAVASAVERSAAALGEKLGLRVVSKRTARGLAKDFLPYRISVSGFDRPGIVSRVSEILARRGVNVASLESHLAYAPLSGTPSCGVSYPPSVTRKTWICRSSASARPEGSLRKKTALLKCRRGFPFR
jgi:glycine cleavage system transcriptional repressor